MTLSLIDNLSVCLVDVGTTPQRKSTLKRSVVRRVPSKTFEYSKIIKIVNYVTGTLYLPYIYPRVSLV